MLKKIKELRANAGISQKKLAEIVGVSQQAINKYENHDTEPDIETLKRMAAYFNTSVDYIIGYEGPNSAAPSDELSPQERDLLSLYRSMTLKQQKTLEIILVYFKGKS